LPLISDEHRLRRARFRELSAKLIGPMLDRVRVGLSLLSSRDGRAAVLLRLQRGKSLHQSTRTTWLDRYPEEFAAAREYLGGRSNLRILSFGCSTGEEVATLRAYFPEARIVGCEMNPHRLKICRSRGLDGKVSFIESDRGLIAASGPYDAIFCMAVLQRRPHMVIRSSIDDISGFYPFWQFDEEVGFLASILHDGGILGLAHTQYLLGDASAGREFRPLPGFSPTAAQGPRFARDGRRLDASVRESTLYVKGAEE
jgi:SAM-dependent methyltransferase